MKKNLLFLLAAALAFAACEKNSEPPMNVIEEKVELKNGKEYSKDYVVTELSAITRLSADSIVYDPINKSFYYLGWNIELDPISYLNLK